MSDPFPNPITQSFQLLERYRTLLRSTLQLQGLRSEDIDEILGSIEVDRGLFFSLNRRYKTGDVSFRQFCARHGLDARLPDRFAGLASRRLYAHQERAILSILAGQTTVVSTGTGSGKTEAFLIPILDHCLKHPGPGVKALIVYPMNALANDQVRRLEEATEGTPVTFALFTGSTTEEDRDSIRREPRDILVTNYVMLDWMLTRSKDSNIFEASAGSLRFLVLDEIHTYRGNKATHLKYLLARLRSRFSGPIVQIGTSATLQSGQIEGYLKADENGLNRFLLPLLDVERYCYVEPEYEPEPEEGAPAPPLPAPSDEGLGWALESDPEAGLAQLGLLTGKAYSQMDLSEDDIAEAEFYQDLKNNAFTRALRSRLIQDGAQSFVELVGLLAGLLPPSYQASRVDDVCRAYLSALAFANHLAGDQGLPLLDFRLHLFLRDIGGHLKRCIKCHKYHSGRQDTCQDCGFPLFCVYRNDIHQCVAKVSGHSLKWELRPESNDRKNTYYVLVSPIGAEESKPVEEALHFREDAPVGEDELVLDYDVYGRLKLRLLPHWRYAEVARQLVPLVDGTRQHQYLYQLVKAILDFQAKGKKKLLGFVDNRARASHYASVLGDEFASEFFEECLKLWLPEGRELDLLQVLDIARRQAPSGEGCTALERSLFDELELWYWRTVCQSPRQYAARQDFLQLKEPEGCTELERGLLNIFLTERAIHKEYEDDRPDSIFIKFSKHLATGHKGIHLVPEERSEDPRYPSISLGKDAREYGEFVQEQGPERVADVVQSLAHRRVLFTDRTVDGKTHYALDPRWVTVHLPESERETYAELKEQLLLTAAAHTSEIADAKRRQVEGEFQEGRLSFVLATPTLEMGIDVGKLQSVLMLGVPPLPSNYAQRAGRAGRGHKDQFALIVTFCSEYDEHDSYYFQRPKLMINGVISPPTFDPLNTEVLRKHIHAHVLAGHVDDRRTLQRFCADLDTELGERRRGVRDLFGPESGAEAYLLGEFRSRLLSEVGSLPEDGKLTPQHAFYADGFFPDYLFRRDQVYVLDEEKPGIAPDASRASLADGALSEREPEQAYYMIPPGETVFMAGDVYDITSDGSYTLLPVGGNVAARSYDSLLARRQVRHASRDRILRRYDRLQLFDNDQPFRDKGRVLGVAYHPACRLIFINRGCLGFEGTQPFSDERGEFALAYQVIRPALVLRFDSLVCADARLYLSLASALERTIKDRYGLDESEIRLLSKVSPDPPDSDGRPWVYVILYDANGNGNVPMAAMFDDFDEIVSTADQKMRDCPGSPCLPCESGCYLCLRSHTTRYLAGRVDKATTLMFTGYLLGRGRFRPSMASPGQPISTFHLELRLERRGDTVEVRAGQACYSASLAGDQNKVIFDLLTHAVQSEFRPAMRTMRVVSREGYVVDAINSGALQKSRGDFARFQFQMLRFREVRAERE
jgi:hypothetical protein